ncbi:condensation domain-containing protein [Streptomyces xiaopingdaonensis]|uniref:condensation domain-containing protein n=1 Tax=Streptomyces xiaopingdaonensis TaxID=1565415 RepID=UPI0002FD848A|nr:condensation domain-containing protein [Streptomyces xiaopingdaonensis]
MRQFALDRLDVEPGRVIRWRLASTAAEHACEGGAERRQASFNQVKHFSTIEESRRAGEPFASWLALTFEIEGQLDHAALESSFLSLARRHEVLRCEFRRLAGDLSAATYPVDEVRLEAEDVGEFGSQEELRAFLSESFRQETDALVWPLYTMGAVVREGGPTTVYLAFDHIVADGISMLNVVHEIQVVYASLHRGEEPHLPEVGSYAEFAHEQRRRFASLRIEDPCLDGWRSFAERGGGFFPRFPLDLGVDPELMYPPVHESALLLGARDTEALDLRCREAGGRMFMGLLAGVAVSLRDLGGPETYRALMPVSERGGGALRNSLGWYVNTLPIEFPVAGFPSFPHGPDLSDLARLLGDVRESFTATTENLQVPFVRAWELLAPQHFTARSWPFPVNFFSYIDTRKGPGSEHHPRWKPVLHVWSSATNGTNSWFVRDAEGLHIDSIYADTPQARATMASLQHVLGETLLAMAAADVPVRV